MRIFLTGATGFVGSHVLAMALAAGHQVVALRRPGASTRLPLDQQPQWVEGSLSDDWTLALQDCDALLHLAAHGVASGAHDWDACLQINVVDAVHLWRQAINVGLRRFVIVGSCFEYGLAGERYEFIPIDAPLQPTTAYGASKAAASTAAFALAVEHQLELVVARLFHVYGQGEAPGRFWPSLVSAAQNREDLPMTSGRQVRDFQPVEQAAEQILQCLQIHAAQPGQPRVVHLGTGRPRSLLQFAQDEWTRLGASGQLRPGEVTHRPNEVWRFVPEITDLSQSSEKPS
ncbi:MAG: NAD-dependent epimerase/dehydratase family protein [Synechococcus sp.]